MARGARDEELEALLRIGREAAAIVSAVYATPFTVEMKGPGDPVTRADREANAYICGELAKRFPGDAVLAEESVPADPAAIAAELAHERVFFVDPLDGTREFADRNGEFAVMIGLVAEGRPLLGVLVAPTTGDALAARVGGAAFLESAGGARQPLRVSRETRPEAIRLMVSRSHRPRIVNPLLAALGAKQDQAIPCGSVGLKVARLATGEADLYAHAGLGAKRWDTAGPEAVLVGAGGRMTDLDGALIDYGDADLTLKNGIVASNGLLHDAALEAIRTIRKQQPKKD